MNGIQRKNIGVSEGKYVFYIVLFLLEYHTKNTLLYYNGASVASYERVLYNAGQINVRMF
jgi:hypothetical protein